jgi:hypothetical protein
MSKIAAYSNSFHKDLNTLKHRVQSLKSEEFCFNIHDLHYYFSPYFLFGFLLILLYSLQIFRTATDIEQFRTKTIKKEHFLKKKTFFAGFIISFDRSSKIIWHVLFLWPAEGPCRHSRLVNIAIFGHFPQICSSSNFDDIWYNIFYSF